MERAVIAYLISVLVQFTAWAGDVTNVEEWVKQSTVTTAKEHFKDGEAALIGDGLRIEHYKRLPWADACDGHTGVLIVHPLASDRPACIKFRPKRSITSSSALRIVLRGSNTKPGVRLKVLFRGKVSHDENIGPTWKDILIPLKLSGDIQADLVIEIWPIGWDFEYCYIDLLEMT